MSTKLPTGKEHMLKACNDIKAQPIKVQHRLKKCVFLDKNMRNEANKKMRTWLTAVSEL